MESCKDWPRGKLPAGFGEEVKSDVPVLIMVGDNDPATSPTAAKAAASRLTNGRVVVVPYGGPALEGLIGKESEHHRRPVLGDSGSADVRCVVLEGRQTQAVYS